ncbi:hypothetical protein APHAL10511_003478 [Amanita phalloides]|nr:hypothetical protein APHAL10511_003478 [Amanita phalloides]
MANSAYNRNPGGNNQHNPCLSADDLMLVQALNKFHREKLDNNTTISKRLRADYGIEMAPATVKRRRKRIAHGDGVHLPRDFVSEVMHTHDIEGFEIRQPKSKEIKRVPKYPLGIHQRWSADGHDKLNKIGFPIYAIVDDATSKWLGAWVVPNNRMGDVVAYLFLETVEKYGGIPLQLTTDCGSETTKAFGIANALREKFHPDIDAYALPPHVYLRSVHNITVERSWYRLRLDFGDNAVMSFEKGQEMGIYNANDPQHRELCRWLWSKLLNEEIQKMMEVRNAARMRKDKNKSGPSGMSRNQAFSLPESWDGTNCLLKIDDLSLIREMKDQLGGKQLLEFSLPEFDHSAQTVYDNLHVSSLTFGSVWNIFGGMLPILYSSDTNDT